MSMAYVAVRMRTMLKFPIEQKMKDSSKQEGVAHDPLIWDVKPC
jgi:hypothetical protein